MSVHVDRLSSLSTTSTLAQLARAGLAFEAGRYQEAKDQLNQMIFHKETTTNFFAVLILCKCCQQARDDALLEKSIKQAQTLLADKVKDDATRVKVAKLLSLMLIMCYERQSKYEQALQMLEDDEGEEQDGDFALVAAKIYAHTGHRTKVQTLLASISSAPARIVVEAVLLRGEGKYEEALEILDDAKASPS